MVFSGSALVISCSPHHNRSHNPHGGNISCGTLNLNSYVSYAVYIRIYPANVSVHSNLRIRYVNYTTYVSTYSAVVSGVSCPHNLVDCAARRGLSKRGAGGLQPHLVNCTLILLAVVNLLVTTFFVHSLINFSIDGSHILCHRGTRNQVRGICDLGVVGGSRHSRACLLRTDNLPSLGLRNGHRVGITTKRVFDRPIRLSDTPRRLPSDAGRIGFVLGSTSSSDVRIRTGDQFVNPRVH